MRIYSRVFPSVKAPILLHHCLYLTIPGIDRNGNFRRVIVFHLLKPGIEEPASPLTDSLTLDQLRQRAFQAASQAEKKEPKEAKSFYYGRSTAVRAYILVRADGICEACNNPAPFQRLDGTPYLEPHHTRRISDGGPDHPRWVGAVCPNCHREAHYGANGVEKNRNLQQHLGKLEQSSETIVSSVYPLPRSSSYRLEY